MDGRPTPFLVLGAMKSGTTSLYRLLADHPDVEIVGEKEASAFLSGGGPEVARRMLESRCGAAGEVTTRYLQQPLWDPPVSAVARHLGPRARLIAILRDPFDRAVSHWRHWRQLGWEADDDPEAALLDGSGAYVAFSSYHRQLAPWVEVFGKDAMLCLRLEDLCLRPSDTLANLWCFLGVSPSAGPVPRENAAGERLVARGKLATVANSVLYRRLIRPAVPRAAKRLLLTLTGGARGRIETPAVDPRVREQFEELVGEDSARLAAIWPELRWPRVGSR